RPAIDGQSLGVEPEDVAAQRREPHIASTIIGSAVGRIEPPRARVEVVDVDDLLDRAVDGVEPAHVRLAGQSAMPTNPDLRVLVFAGRLVEVARIEGHAART